MQLTHAPYRTLSRILVRPRFQHFLSSQPLTIVFPRRNFWAKNTQKYAGGPLQSLASSVDPL